MSTIKEQEESLFAEWIKHEEWIHREDWTGMEDYTVEEVFCPDGLHFTGEVISYLDSDGNLFKEVTEGNQENLWGKAFLKPVFLCKDYNGKFTDAQGKVCYGWMDIRTESGYYGGDLYWRFYSKYMILLYALTNYDHETNAFPSFEESRIKDNYWDGDNGFFHSPVVRMNLKKIAGGNNCEDWLLKEYIKHDKEFLTRQKDIYQGANIFVCCHGGDNNPIMEELIKDRKWFPDLQPYEPSCGYIWYSPSQKVIVIHEYHMSDRRVSYWDYYRAIPYLQDFLSKHKGFLGL